MNILFGVTPPQNSESAEPDICSVLAQIHGAPGQWINGASGPARIGCLQDEGVVLGVAQDGLTTVAFLGAITAPLPGWQAGSPLDDPNRTADYLLERYRTLESRFLDGIVGQYAVAICDARQGRLLLAADPGGMRTFFVQRDNQGLTFSSNLFSLARSLGGDLTIDRSLEDFFLIHGFYPWGRTPYRGITALKPGQILDWQDGQIEFREIAPGDPWEGRFNDLLEPDVPEDRVLDLLYEALLTATEEQLASDDRAAVLLGGFDSALVASLLYRLGKRVETYSFHYQDGDYNQPHTETLASFLGSKHHWVTITRDILENGLAHFPTVFNQPTNWPNYVIQTAYLCQVMRDEGFRYCYSGDGCDAAFLGYPGTYRRARLFEALPRLSGNALQALLKLLARPSLDRALGHPYRVLLNMVRALGRDMPARGYLSFRILDEISLQQLRKNESPKAEQSLEQIIEALAKPFAGLPTLRLAYQGKAGVSPNKNKIVGSSDLNGVAILSPYLHPGMKALATRLPESLMRPEAKTRSKVTGKYILMRMAEAKGLLPSEVIYQRKVAAVDGPIDSWYAGPLRPQILSMLDDLPFDYDKAYAEALLRPKLAESLFKRHLMTDKVISHAASLLATYATFAAAARREG